MSSSRHIRKTALNIAMGLGLMAALPAAFAANNDGTVVGHTRPGATVTVVSPDTGFTRTVTADDSGNYRLPFLPIGRYTLTSEAAGQAVGAPVNVTVSLGNATTVNLVSRDAVELGGVTVTGASVASAVDVTSTESATNVTRQELARLPVDQNVASVALLAPGVVKGNAGFGGISFGGSSIAENSFYVNGLNVTDFYNRNGFSEAPFAFYQEFQVKTGGYSVEFGRTTGGVVNAVARSGTNEFHAGTEITMEPGNWHSRGGDYTFDGERYYTSSRDRDSLIKTNVWASGPIVKDKLFFFAMYEQRGASPRNTNDTGTSITDHSANQGFWGGTIDWNITDSNTLSLMAFSDKNRDVGDVYNYDYDTDTRTAKSNEVYTDTGGRNWALTWTSYLTNDLSMKLMYGRNERQADVSSQRDEECNRVAVSTGAPQPPGGLTPGCTSSSNIASRVDTRKQYRADFEWTLGDHLLRFGYDHELDTSDYARRYPGPGGYYYNVYANTGDPADTDGGGSIPAGDPAWVRVRRYEIAGTFETENSALYLEDNWQLTPNLVLNAGLRNDSFDNRDASGRSYIKINKQIAPRLGFAWDMKGDGSTKLFGNLGRYYLPVANVINIKQAGGLLDERSAHRFLGWETREINGVQYAFPIVGDALPGSHTDTSQGDGTVGDLRSEVDKDMDPVYQDEAILGFQQMINAHWSWGVSGTYRRLHNAIDDMEISATPQCGGDGYIGYVMANPGKNLTVYGDTDCDGTADGYINIDTSKQGFALYDSDGNYLGQRGWVKPKRTYSSLEFQLDRAWDEKWSFNASYVLAWNRGNAEGPVNSDTDFDDTGRTENFDDPWVNFGGDGFLPNDRRHQLKLRGVYALTPHWQVSGDMDIHSGGPITGFGVGNPYDASNYHSYFICVDKCGNIPGATDADGDPVPYPSEDRVYERSPRGKYGRLPWTYTLNAGIAYIRPFNGGNLRVKLAVYNLLNQQRTVQVDQDLQTGLGDNDTGTGPAFNDTFRLPIGFQSPRFTQLTVALDF
ncbi:TonB-dependent receptor [Dyella sp.]|jgi:outer membrane receptor protein involved in Fe transport|uniref:TonB-dependent receptor n=1 Tax=Dyella sp. TaxID=1869338 RepID=UPI002D78961E|nr:carboxypeptidase regulatory-like domain-containing protein [Dyella sp.]HET6431156.1 carboxypeptidase regulatory-like domain-containing protein [Dyella sp.]